MTERLLSIGRYPTRQGIDTAGQRPVGMHAAAALTEKTAVAVFLRQQHCAAIFRKAFDELGRRDAEKPCKAQDFVRADTDCLVAATPIAGVTGVREWTVTLHVEVDAGNQIAVGHEIASSSEAG